MMYVAPTMPRHPTWLHDLDRYLDPMVDGHIVSARHAAEARSSSREAARRDAMRTQAAAEREAEERFYAEERAKMLRLFG